MIMVPAMSVNCQPTFSVPRSIVWRIRHGALIQPNDLSTMWRVFMLAF
jgi:hypothetical protein